MRPFISVICDGVVCASLFVPCGSSVGNDYSLLEKEKEKTREKKKWRRGRGREQRKQQDKMKFENEYEAM